MSNSDPDQIFRVDQIDHFELFVPDRHEAARWYERILELEIIHEHDDWADDPRGPLMISSDQGGTKLALFQGRPTDPSNQNGIHLIAFRVGSRSFLRFLNRLDELNLTDHNHQTVTRQLVVDHQRAFSVYFCDPWQNRLELTTYEYEHTVMPLKRLQDDPQN